ncbi:MAG: hypothetical protein GXP47_01225 [Acidobacteria bacterium]|nr:hypothetical protein [Acidobacteriota bacterium]
MADMRSIATAVEQYQVDFNFYPKVAGSTVRDIINYVTPTYIKKMPVNDGWNMAFAWVGDSTNGNDYTIICYGKGGSRDSGLSSEPRTTSFTADIYFSNGQFIQWPEGLQID